MIRHILQVHVKQISTSATNSEQLQQAAWPRGRERARRLDERLKTVHRTEDEDHLVFLNEPGRGQRFAGRPGAHHACALL